MNGAARARAPGEDAPAQSGLPPRRLAAKVLRGMLDHAEPLDEVLERFAPRADREGGTVSKRDLALARSIVLSALRRLGTIRRALGERMAKGVPGRSGPLEAVLVVGAAQILFLDVPDHAAVDTAVRLAREDRRSGRFEGLVNAVLRRIAREREAILAASDPLRDDAPAWLAERWVAAYGEARARAIAAAHCTEPGLDLTVKADPAGWAERLSGHVMPNGSVRLASRVGVRDLAGYDEGGWWVQDASASMPARLLAARPGERVADLCAAPGGKAAQLAAAGARVTAVERSGVRLARLAENMRRLNLEVEAVEADILGFEPAEPFDAILLDVPCSATGTIRRHPDVAWTKRPEDVAGLSGIQARLLDKAVTLLRPGGRLVYATCSLEPEEGERQIEALLARAPGLRPVPATPAEAPGLGEAIDPAGFLRITPDLWPSPEPRLSGLDGFFVARLVKA